MRRRRTWRQASCSPMYGVLWSANGRGCAMHSCGGLPGGEAEVDEPDVRALASATREVQRLKRQSARLRTELGAHERVRHPWAAAWTRAQASGIDCAMATAMATATSAAMETFDNRRVRLGSSVLGGGGGGPESAVAQSQSASAATASGSKRWSARQEKAAGDAQRKRSVL